MSRGLKLWIGILGTLLVAAAIFGAAVRGRARGPGADVRVITHGEEVDLAAHLAPGKYTLFDFYAVWCPPCRVLSPALERLAAIRPESLAIRKVDIVDWTMPVAAQHHVESLPYLVLFDPQGRRVADGEAVFAALDLAFGDAAREVDESTREEAPARPEPPGGDSPVRPTPM